MTRLYVNLLVYISLYGYPKKNNKSNVHNLGAQSSIQPRFLKIRRKDFQLVPYSFISQKEVLCHTQFHIFVSQDFKPFTPTLLSLELYFL